MAIVPQPLHISSRLMAALTLFDGTETIGTLHVNHIGQSVDDRCAYAWVIERPDRTVLAEGADLASGVGAEVAYGPMMAAFVDFLGADGETYAGCARRGEDVNDARAYCFGPDVARWAADNLSALEYAAAELSPDGE
jgi:hypothetical protein